MIEFTQKNINDLAKAPVTAVSLIIDGKVCGAISGRVREVISPIDRSILAHIPDCGPEDVDRAVQAARSAFERHSWRGMSPKDRKRIMLRWASLIEAERLQLAVLQTRDQGQPVEHAWTLDLGFAIDAYRWYAEAADKLYNESIVLDDGLSAIITRMPLGVVAAVLPWNAPAMIGAWKLGPALLTGNSVIVKPSEESSLVCLRIVELALEAGIPSGVVQVLTGDGRVGAALANHLGVDCLTFTGSGSTGRSIMRAAADSNLKRVSLELGGKSANIIMADTRSIADAAAASVGFMFSNQGQVCEAPSRMLVERCIFDEMLDAVKVRAAALTIGNPLDLSTELGPIVNKKQFDTVCSYIERAEFDGATLQMDGRKAPVPKDGYYLGPTIATNVGEDSTLAQEEVFGPVLSMFAFDTIDDAIAMANNSKFGLGASIWSSNIDTVMHATQRIVAGNINVNGGSGPLVELPYGGFKESGFGRDRSFHAIEKYTDLKNIIIKTRP